MPIHLPLNKQSHSCGKTSHLILANFSKLKNKPISKSEFCSPLIFSIQTLCNPLCPSSFFRQFCVRGTLETIFKLRKASWKGSVWTTLKDTYSTNIQNCQRTQFVHREGIFSPNNTNALENEGEMLFLWVLQFFKESFSGLRLVTIILHSQAQVAVETFHEFLGQRDCFIESIHFFLI